MATRTASIILDLLPQLIFFYLFTYNNMVAGCPQQCSCHGNRNLSINCSSLNLVTPPLTSVSTLTLNLSHNALGPIINSSFVQMRNLTLIDLSYNGLTRLLGCTFSGMLDLRTVRLRGNGLESLPDSLFADSNKVEVLDISFNRFTEIPDEVLRSLPELRTLDVSNNLIGRLKLGARFQVTTQIQTLDFSHNPIQSLQGDSFEVSTNWATTASRSISLAFCLISSVETGAFLSFPNLNNLDLSGNSVPLESLTTIVKELATKNIERLSLALMNLTTIESLFAEMSELPLKFLNVSFNRITDLPPNVFSNIKSLKELDISGNFIPSLTEGFSDLISLSVLNISHNRLESFQGDAVQHLSNLVTLDLSYNKLEDSSRVNFSPLLHLNTLDVSNNGLTSAVLPERTSNLQHLNYSFNKITSFNVIKDATKLQFVDFSNNNIQFLPGLLFNGARFLQLVNFSRNHIATLDHGAFLPQSSIIIDLSFNFLKEIRYSNWVATQKLHINHNELTHIDSQSFYGMSGLQELDLASNRLTTLHEDLFQYLTMLTHLNVSHNFLDRIHWFSLFRSLELLKTLDLGHNNISYLNESIFLPLPEIRAVSFRNNLLRSINPNTFKNLNEIKSIDLSNNPLDCSCNSLSFRDWIKKTDLNILGLYEANSTAYLCRTPHERSGLHVTQWNTIEFECDKSMLYVIVFCSTLVLLSIFALIGAAIYRFYINRRSRQDEIRKKLELEKERSKRAKKIEFVRLIEKKVETSSDGRRERSTSSANEISGKRNGFVPWPGETQGEYGRGRTRSGKVESGSRLVENEKDVRRQMKSSGGKGYEKLGRDEWTEEELRKKRGRESDDKSRRRAEEVPQTEAGSRRDVSSQRQKERREREDSDLGFVHSERHGGSPHAVPSGYDQFIRDPRLRREHERSAYPEGYPRYNSGPYIISTSHTFPCRWEGRRVWGEPQEWSNFGYRKSGDEDHRIDMYKGVPIGERDVGRVKSGVTTEEGYRDNGLNQYPLEVHFNERSYQKRSNSRGGEEPHQRNNYHQRSLSYNCLPQDYLGDTPFLKEAGPRGRDNRRYIRPQVVVGHRAASQPYLSNEGTSGWL